MHLYVMEQGAKIYKRGEHLIICKGERTLDDVTLDSVESLALFGSVQPTFEVMSALLANGVEVSLLSSGGHFKGRVVPSVCKNVPLRLKQYDAFRNPELSFEIAKGCIERKLLGGLHVLDSYNYNAHNDFGFAERDDYLRNLERLKKCCESKDALRGYEGYGARIYFGAFARCLKNDVLFPGRVYYPSTDPVNALLSFGYSFLARLFESLLESMGMDPAIGFLHEVSYGRSSLALDMMEEFRHVFIDRLVLNLFNKRYVVSEDFELREEEGMPGQLYLKPDAAKVFISNYEEFCDSPNKVYEGCKEATWRQGFRRRVESLRRFFMGNAAEESFDWNLLMEECA